MRRAMTMREKANERALVPRLARLAVDTDTEALKRGSGESSSDPNAKKLKQGHSGLQEGDADMSEPEKREEEEAARKAEEEAARKAEEEEKESLSELRDRAGLDKEALKKVAAAQAAAVQRRKDAASAKVENLLDWEVYDTLMMQQANLSTVLTKQENMMGKLLFNINGTAKDEEPSEQVKEQIAELGEKNFRPRKEWRMVPTDTDEIDPKTKQKKQVLKPVLQTFYNLSSRAQVNDIELYVPFNCWEAHGLLNPYPDLEGFKASADDWKRDLNAEQVRAVTEVLGNVTNGLEKNREAQASIPMYFATMKDAEGEYVEFAPGFLGTQFECRPVPSEEELEKEFEKEKYNGLTPEQKRAMLFRSHLFMFTVDVDDEDHAGGGVTLTQKGLYANERGFGPEPTTGDGPFLKRCRYPKELERDPETLRPVNNTKNMKLYHRTNRYRMEVARLWWKLYQFQANVVTETIESKAGIWGKSVDKTSGIAAQDEENYMVLCVAAFGAEGALEYGTVSPHHKEVPVEKIDDVSGASYVVSPKGIKQQGGVTPADADWVVFADPKDRPDEPRKTVRLDNDRTWPVIKISHSLAWSEYRKSMIDNNRSVFQAMGYMFGAEAEYEDEDEEETRLDWLARITKGVVNLGDAEARERRRRKNLVEKSNGKIDATFDWDERAWDLYFSKLADKDTAWESETAQQIMNVLEDAFENLIDAMPAWANIFLSLDLVDDEVAMEEDTDAIRSANAELAKVGAALNKVPKDSKAAHLLSCYDKQLRAAHQGRGAVYREAGSFVYNCYPTDVSAERDKIDRLYSKDGVSWAHEQLMRSVLRVQIRNNFDAYLTKVKEVEKGPDGIKRELTPEEREERALLNRMEDDYEKESDDYIQKDESKIAPYLYLASLGYRQWYVEKYLKRSVGVGWTVTLTNMLDFSVPGSGDRPWYTQAQGLSGIIIDVTKDKKSQDVLQPDLYTVVVSYDEFRVRVEVDSMGRVTNNWIKWHSTPAEEDQLPVCDEHGRMIVQVHGKHIWPRWTSSVASEDPGHSLRTPHRYGDKVRFDEKVWSFYSKKAKTDKNVRLKDYAVTTEYAAVDYTWLAPMETLKQLNYGRYAEHEDYSFAKPPAEVGTSYNKEIQARLKKVGDLTVVPWTAKTEHFWYLRYPWAPTDQNGGIITEYDDLDRTDLVTALRSYYPPARADGKKTTDKHFQLKTMRATFFVTIPIEGENAKDEKESGKEAFVKKVAKHQEEKLAKLEAEAKAAQGKAAMQVES